MGEKLFPPSGEQQEIQVWLRSAGHKQCLYKPEDLWISMLWTDEIGEELFGLSSVLSNSKHYFPQTPHAVEAVQDTEDRWGFFSLFCSYWIWNPAVLELPMAQNIALDKFHFAKFWVNPYELIQG